MEDMRDHFMDKGWHLHEGQDPGSRVQWLSCWGRIIIGISFKCHLVSGLAATMQQKFILVGTFS